MAVLGKSGMMARGLSYCPNFETSHETLSTGSCIPRSRHVRSPRRSCPLRCLGASRNSARPLANCRRPGRPADHHDWRGPDLRAPRAPRHLDARAAAGVAPRNRHRARARLQQGGIHRHARVRPRPVRHAVPAAGLPDNDANQGREGGDRYQGQAGRHIRHGRLGEARPRRHRVPRHRAGRRHAARRACRASRGPGRSRWT